ncbi:hypothetical protein XENOCAPTIV_023908 [Xenoophorus captivus]|uniref:Uncharacterized protein n=1 Tax=Xenoophorus captivus TaxID=1517983 RepID=A0ABV0RIS6_9TELE
MNSIYVYYRSVVVNIYKHCCNTTVKSLQFWINIDLFYSVFTCLWKYYIDTLYCQKYLCVYFYMHMNFDEIIFIIYKVQFVDGPTVASSRNYNYSVNIFQGLGVCS